MSKLIIPDNDAATYLHVAGFTGYRIVTFVAIGLAESGLDAHAVGVNDHDPTKVTYRSLDLGWLQLNSFYWIDYQRRAQEALDPQTCAALAWLVFTRSGGTQWLPVPGYNAWNTYKVGRHVQFMSRGLAAWRAIGSPS